MTFGECFTNSQLRKSLLFKVTGVTRMSGELHEKQSVQSKNLVFSLVYKTYSRIHQIIIMQGVNDSGFYAQEFPLSALQEARWVYLVLRKNKK